MKALFVRPDIKIFLVITIIISIALTLLSKQYNYFFFDLWFTKLIQIINLPLVDSLLKFITFLGNHYPAAISLIIVSSAFFLYGFKRESIMLVFSTMGAVGISESLKFLVSRPRPDPFLIRQVEVFLKNDSFPSGHVLFFMGFYGYLLYLSLVMIPKKKLRNFFAVFFLNLIILAGISRIYLGAHWFSDVLGSFLIGGIWLYTVVLIFKRFKR